MLKTWGKRWPRPSPCGCTQHGEPCPHWLPGAVLQTRAQEGQGKGETWRVGVLALTLAVLCDCEHVTLLSGVRFPSTSGLAFLICMQLLPPGGRPGTWSRCSLRELKVCPPPAPHIDPSGKLLFTHQDPSRFSSLQEVPLDSSSDSGVSVLPSLTAPNSVSHLSHPAGEPSENKNRV